MVEHAGPLRTVVSVALLVVFAAGACGSDGSTPSDRGQSATATTSVGTPDPSAKYQVPPQAQPAFCSAVGHLRAAPAQSSTNAADTFGRAAADLDTARQQITGTRPNDFEAKSALASLGAGARSLAIATKAGDDPTRRALEESVLAGLAEYAPDCG